MKSYPSIPCFCCTLIYATVRSTKLGHFGKNIPNRTFQIEQRAPFQYGGPISRSLPSHVASSISMEKVMSFCCCCLFFFKVDGVIVNVMIQNCKFERKTKT